jgi:hypothetical protein
MNTSKAAVVVNAILGRVASLVGYIGGFFFLLGTVALLSTSDTSSLPVSLILLAIFGVLIFKGSQIKRRIMRFKRYVFLISKQNITSLDSIAANTSKSVDFVRKDLQVMIRKNFFVNATIDTATNEIIIAGSTAPSASAPAQAQPNTQLEAEVFTCPGCGASGKRHKGVPGNCDYCGSLI